MKTVLLLLPGDLAPDRTCSGPSCGEVFADIDDLHRYTASAHRLGVERKDHDPFGVHTVTKEGAVRWHRQD